MEHDNLFLEFQTPDGLYLERDAISRHKDCFKFLGRLHRSSHSDERRISLAELHRFRRVSDSEGIPSLQHIGIACSINQFAMQNED